MANIIKKGCTCTNKKGESMTYSAIDNIVNCKREKSATIIRKLYKDKLIADKSKEDNQDYSMETCQIVCKNWTEEIDGKTIEHNDYDDYLSPSAVEKDKDGFSCAYQYWNDKAPESVGLYVKSNWESDEN